jgi:PEP-CTERM motif
MLTIKEGEISNMARTRWLFGLMAIGCALLMPLTAEATIINGFVNTSDGSLQTMQAPSNSGTAFWNNSSFDNPGNLTPGCNVGFVLTTAGALSNCSGASGTGKNISTSALQFLGSGGSGLNPAHFNFQSSGLGTTFIFTDTAYIGTDALYWYDISSGSPPADAAHLIFNASDAVGTTKTISGLPLTGWGLLLVTGESGSPHYLSNGPGFGQFALFYQSNGQYYAGMEDLVITGGDKDYNDMIIQFAPVPEPATIFLVGLGLIAFGYAERRRLIGRQH